MLAKQIELHNLYLEGFETERLFLRRLDINDIEQWVDFFEDNPSLPYLNIKLHTDRWLMSKRWVKAQLKRYEKGEFGHLGLIDKNTGRLVGQSGLILREVKGETVFELAYSLLPKVWGKGLAHEAGLGLIDFTFRHQMTNRLISIIQVNNIASQKVALKNGLIRKERIRYNNRDVYIYQITMDDWNERKIFA